MMYLSPALLAIFPLLHTSTYAQCYYPNGNETDDSSCYPNSDVSYCCPTSYDCSVSKVCVSQDQKTFLRGSCTDLSWKDLACPNFCLTSTEPATDAAHRMSHCGGNASSSLFCCWGDDGSECDCNDSGAVFALPHLEMYGEIVSVSSGTSPIATLSDFSTVLSLPARSSQGESVTSKGSSVASTQTTSTSRAQSTGLPNEASHVPNSLSAGTRIGIGVGAGLVVALLFTTVVILSILLYRARKQIRDLSEPWESPRTPRVHLPAANVLDKPELAVGSNQVLHELGEEDARCGNVASERPREVIRATPNNSVTHYAD